MFRLRKRPQITHQWVRAHELRDDDYVYDFGTNGEDGVMLGDTGYATIHARDTEDGLILVRSSAFKLPFVWTMNPTDWVQIHPRPVS